MLEFKEKIDKALLFNDGLSRIKALDIVIDETNSSSLPADLKERVIKRCASLQFEAVASLDFSFG